MQRTLRSHPTPDHETMTSISTRSNHALSGHINGDIIFGPEAPDIRVHPPRGQPNSDLEQNIRKPRAGMIIRLTPELLATLQSPSPKPTVELVLKSAVEGSCISVDTDSGFNVTFFVELSCSRELVHGLISTVKYLPHLDLEGRIDLDNR